MTNSGDNEQGRPTISAAGTPWTVVLHQVVDPHGPTDRLGLHPLCGADPWASGAIELDPRHKLACGCCTMLMELEREMTGRERTKWTR